jgi:hypothetical protein
MDETERFLSWQEQCRGTGFATRHSGEHRWPPWSGRSEDLLAECLDHRAVIAKSVPFCAGTRRRKFHIRQMSSERRRRQWL